LKLDETRISCDGTKILMLQTDGVLVVFDSTGIAFWSSSPFNGDLLTIDTNGVLRLLFKGDVAWSQNGKPGSYLQITNSGSLVVRDQSNIYWST
jgi:hypothetical protein